MEPADLVGLSGKKCKATLDAILAACQAYIAGPFTQLDELVAQALPKGSFKIEADEDDGQTVLFGYPAVTAAGGDYIRAAVKIEEGAKSAQSPLDIPPRSARVIDRFRKNGPRCVDKFYRLLV